jgi:hypothetical protein
MPTVTGDELRHLLNLEDDTDFDIENAEIAIDQAINTINLYLLPYDMEIANLSGVTPAKTLTVDKATKGGIYQVASAAYSSFFKASGSGSSSEAASLGPLSHSRSDSSSSSTSAGGESRSAMQAVAREVALMLRDQMLESEIV